MAGINPTELQKGGMGLKKTTTRVKREDGRVEVEGLVGAPANNLVDLEKRRGLLSNIRRFDKNDMEEVDKTIRGETVVVSRNRAAYQIEDGEDKAEYFDEPEDVRDKIKKLAAYVRGCKHMVAYTGAGISTSSDIPDYRGPNGAWTKLAERAPVQNKATTIADAVPSLAHRALADLAAADIVDCVVSTNLDGLHLRSGLSPAKLAELHGNAFNGRCSACRRVYYWLPANVGNFDENGVPTDGPAAKQRSSCGCGSVLRSTGVGFGSDLPPEEMQKAKDASQKCDLALVLGTSMRVSPACNLPEHSYKNNGHLIICNLQKTPYERERIPRECYICPRT